MRLHILPTLALAAGLLLAATVCETSCTKAEQTQLETAAINEGIAIGSCVLSQALGGQTSALAIATTCGIPAAIDVMSVVAQMLATLEGPAVDGAVSLVSPTSERGREIVALKAVHK